MKLAPNRPQSSGYMVQNIIFWPVYSQLGSKSRPLLVQNFGHCTSQIVVYQPKLRYFNQVLVPGTLDFGHTNLLKLILKEISAKIIF